MADQRLNIDIQAQDKTRAAFASAQRSITGFKSEITSVKSALHATFAVAGVGALAAFAKRSIDAADAIAKTANKIGLSTDTLQEYRYALDLAGVSQSEVDKGLEQVAVRVGELKNGTGTLLTFLEKYDEQLGINIRQTRNADQAIDLLTDAIAKEADATQKAALARAAFGRSGTAFVNAVKDGAAAFEDARQKARDLGLVIDGELLRDAERAKDQLTTLGRVIDVRLTQAMLAAAPAIGGAAEALSGFVQELSSVERRSVSVLQKQEAELVEMIETQKSLISQIRNAPMDAISGLLGSPSRLEGYEMMLARIREQLSNIRHDAAGDPFGTDVFGFGDTRDKPKRPPASITDADKKMVDTVADQQIKEIMEQHREWQKVQNEGKRIFEQTRTPIEQYNAKVGRLNDLLSEGAIDQDTFNRATSKASEELHRQREAIEDAATKLEGEFVDGWRMAGDAVEDFVRRGDYSLKAFAQIALETLIDVTRAYDDGFAGISFNPGAKQSKSFFSFLGFADGGRPPVGKASLVGERGPELFVPDRAGTIVPNHMMGGARHVTVNVVQNNEVRGGDASQLQALVPQIVNMSKAAVIDGIRRGEEGLSR